MTKPRAGCASPHSAPGAVVELNSLARQPAGRRSQEHIGGADRSEAAEIAATEIAATAEVAATVVAAARVITARVVTTALATARVVTTGIATRMSPAVGVSGVISGVIAAADSRHPGEQAGGDQVRADAPRAGDQRRLPPGFGVPAARPRPAGHHAARVVVLGPFARVGRGLVLMSVDVDRAVLGHRSGLLLPGDRRQFGPGIDTEGRARRPHVVKALVGGLLCQPI